MLLLHLRLLLLLLLLMMMMILTAALLNDGGLELGRAFDNVRQSVLRRGLDANGISGADASDVDRRLAVIGVKTGQGRESGRLEIELHAAATPAAGAAAVAAAAAAGAVAATARWQGLLDRRQRVAVPGGDFRLLIFGPAVDTMAARKRGRQRGRVGGRGLDRRRILVNLRGGQRGGRGDSLRVLHGQRGGRRGMELCAGLVGRGGQRGGGRLRGRQARSVVSGRGRQRHVAAAVAAADGHVGMRVTAVQRRHGRRMMMVRMMMRMVVVIVAAVVGIGGIDQAASVGTVSLSISARQRENYVKIATFNRAKTQTFSKK